MIKLTRKYLGDLARMDYLAIAFGFVGVCQGLTFMTLIFLFRALFTNNFPLAWRWFWALLGVAIVSTVANMLVQNRANGMSVLGVCDQLIRRVGQRLVKLPLGWFDASSKAKVVRVLKQDVNTLSHGPSVILPLMVTNLATAATIMICSLIIDWRLSLAILIAFPLALLVYRWNQRVIDAPQTEHSEIEQLLGSRTVEFAQLQPVLRASGFGLAGQRDAGMIWPVLGKVMKEEATSNAAILTVTGRPTGLFQAIVMLASAATLLSGLWLVNAGLVDAISYIAIMLVVTRFTEPLALFSIYGNEEAGIRKAVLSAAEVINAELLPEPENPVEVNAPGVSLSEVDFGYEDEQVLHDVSLVGAQQGVTALVGPSGSGKTTILRLLARFWDAELGEVCHGGVDVRKLGTGNVMANSAMVFQNVYLFDTTIRENILLAKPDATEEELEAAAKAAALDEVLGRLPDGWDTQVGEGGAFLSGGERQRVSLARAFLRDCQVVLLDEATSSLDGISELQVTKSIAELAKTRAVIVVAHRLSTVRRANQIFTLANGHICESGTHAELLAADGIYAQFWRDQQAAGKWELR